MSGIITGLYYLNLANMLGIFMLVIIIVTIHYCERGWYWCVSFQPLIYVDMKAYFKCCVIVAKV